MGSNIVAGLNDFKTLENFPGSSQILHLLPEESCMFAVDEQTAVVLMTHSYATDPKFFLELKNSSPIYLGLLGSSKRRNTLLNDFFESVDYYNKQLLEVAH